MGMMLLAEKARTQTCVSSPARLQKSSSQRRCTIRTFVLFDDDVYLCMRGRTYLDVTEHSQCLALKQLFCSVESSGAATNGLQFLKLLSLKGLEIGGDREVDKHQQILKCRKIPEVFGCVGKGERG